MSRLELPKPLQSLMKSSASGVHIQAFADVCGEILADNKLPFFPDYTDHGTTHISSLLHTEVELVPEQVWGQSAVTSRPRLLCDADAIILIGATLLHDLGMHLRHDGFLELVSKDSRFRPLWWFKDEHDTHTGDKAWFDLWGAYCREARQFSDRDLSRIVGVDSVRGGWSFDELPADTGMWTRNHCLIIGEFLRRHHARLAHEIAIYGFPGLPIGNGVGFFPALAKDTRHPLSVFADLIGLVARSHGTSLRLCKSYIDSNPIYSGTPRPRGAVIYYLMALLRIADYMQLEGTRAPTVLLNLRNPPSKISLTEWKKHNAIKAILPANDPKARFITVDHEIDLEVFLQVRDLLAGLQAEIDHSIAVLGEVYESRNDLGLNKLQISVNRIHSNIDHPAFLRELPFFPQQTGFSSHPNLLTLLVEPLYGNAPEIGIRELMQNAVDAVRELGVWCETRAIDQTDVESPEQNADVLIEFIEKAGGHWLIRVQDKGIGMSGDTIQNYFLCAGASFRQSADWSQEFLDQEGEARTLRTGRFGIGVFALFLLGSRFRLWSRHASASTESGHFVEADVTSHLIPLRRISGLPVGSTIEVDLSESAVKTLSLNSPDVRHFEKTDWFCYNWPKVVRRVVRQSGTVELTQKHSEPVSDREIHPAWSRVQSEDFRDVRWTWQKWPSLVCNGFEIRNDSARSSQEFINWPEILVRKPAISIEDHASRLPLNLQRNALTRKDFPFTDDLVCDVMLSVIAHALVCGPENLNEAMQNERMHPLVGPSSTWYYQSGWAGGVGNPSGEGQFRWVSTTEAFSPDTPWLRSLLGCDRCLHFERLALNGWRVDVTAAIPSASHFVSTYEHYIVIDSPRPGDPEAELATIKSLLPRATSSGDSVLVVSRLDRIYQHLAEEVLSDWREIPMASSSVACYQTYSAASQPNSIGIKVAEFIIDQNSSDATWKPCFLIEERYESPTVEHSRRIDAIWNNCLGCTSIPFNAEARKLVIERGQAHSQLNAHIQKWTALKGSGFIPAQ